MAKTVNGEEILESTAKLMLSVFSENYDNRFEEMLVSGGGGNTMFVNAWQKPSKEFLKFRISSQAKKRLKKHKYTLTTMPHTFLYSDEKILEKRKSKGKELHLDHNPGNVVVLHLIRDHVREYRKKWWWSKKRKIADLKRFLADIQTLDIITVEQDDIRTRPDNKMGATQKSMLSAKDRDDLLCDEFECLGCGGFKYK